VAYYPDFVERLAEHPIGSFKNRKRSEAQHGKAGCHDETDAHHEALPYSMAGPRRGTFQLTSQSLAKFVLYIPAMMVVAGLEPATNRYEPLACTD
jgi:hypothetical protein